jgi:hypothetical protein
VDALHAKTAALVEQLGAAERGMAVVQADPALYARVRPRFEKLFLARWEKLRTLQKDVEAGVSADLCWRDLIEERTRCEALFRECLACMQGASVRRAGLDGGLCHLADALLHHLGSLGDRIRWDRFTILADGEAFAGMAEIIRLRFPETGVWNLPVVAHEFGHFVGPELETRDVRGVSSHPFQEVLEREANGDGWIVGRAARPPAARIRAFLHEFFADVFATYALGPAYACTCVFLRLDPVDADREGATHPSALRRAHAIFRTLEAMDAAEGGLVPTYAAVTAALRATWARTLAGAGHPGVAVDAEHAARLDPFLDELYAMLRRELPTLRYGRPAWLRAERLAAGMDPDRGSPALTAVDTIPDVLNAAWLARLDAASQDPYRVGRIGERALDACRTLAGAA